MIPKHFKTKAIICCFTPTLTVILEVLVSFGVIGSNIGSIMLQILAGGFLVTLILDLILFYKRKGLTFTERLKKKETMPLFILTLLVIIPASIAVFFFQAKSIDIEETATMSRKYNQDCLIGFYDQHDLWHVFSASAIYLGYFTLYKSYKY